MDAVSLAFPQLLLYRFIRAKSLRAALVPSFYVPLVKTCMIELLVLDVGRLAVTDFVIAAGWRRILLES